QLTRPRSGSAGRWRKRERDPAKRELAGSDADGDSLTAVRPETGPPGGNACRAIHPETPRGKNKQRGSHFDYPLSVLPGRPIYSSTKILFSAHISFRIFGHTVTLTSPRWALRSSSIKVRDWPIPPPIESGIWSFRIAR